MARSRKNEKGQATLILVLALGLVLVGGMGLAIDGANLYHQQQMAQVAADAAATAAAMNIFRGNYVHSPPEVTDFPVNTSFTCTTTATRLPCQFARENGFGSIAADKVIVDYPTCTVSGGSPYGSCGYGDTLASDLPAGVPSQVRVTVKRDVNNSIIRMLGMGAITTIGTTATAAVVEVLSPTPIIITDYKNPDSLYLNGTNSITVCGGPSQSVQVNSTDLAAYHEPSGGTGYIYLQYGGDADDGDCVNGTGSNFGITGGPTGSGGGTVNRVNLGTTGQYTYHSPIPDPYAGVPMPGQTGAPVIPPIPTGTNPITVTSSSSPNYGCTAPNAQGTTCKVYKAGKYGTCAGCTKFDFTGVNNIIFMPGLYYVQGGGATFKNDNGGTLPLLDPTSPNSNPKNPYTGTICTGCIADADTGTGMVIFDTGDGNHNGGGFDINTGAFIAFQGPTKTQVIAGNTVPAGPYYGLTMWEDNQSTNFIPHQLGQGNGCFQVQGTVYITPTLDIMMAHPAQTKYQEVQYSGTPCSDTVLKGDIVVSDLTLNGTAAIKMELESHAFLKTYQVALVAGGFHP